MTGCFCEKQEGKLVLARDVGGSIVAETSRLIGIVQVSSDSGHIFLKTRATKRMYIYMQLSTPRQK